MGEWGGGQAAILTLFSLDCTEPTHPPGRDEDSETLQSRVAYSPLHAAEAWRHQVTLEFSN